MKKNSQNNIRFRLNSDIRIGLGILENFCDEVSHLRMESPLVICDQNLVTSGYFKRLLPSLSKFAANGTLHFLKLQGEPSYELLTKLLNDLNIDCYDGIVSVGGGSVMDIGKGLALLATNPNEPKALKGFPLGLKKPLPHVTVPSVLGSGAEASFNAVFIDLLERRKLGINSINNFPVLVLSDPLLTMSAPSSVVLSSALDCMVHCVDSFGSHKSNDFSKMFSVQGFSKIWSYLSEKSLEDSEARLMLAQASILGIYGLMNSGDGPTNGFAYYFGVKNEIPHGIAGGMFLGDVMRWNVKNGYGSYGHLMRDTASSDMDQFFTRYIELLQHYKVPTLADYSYSETDIAGLSVDVSKALSGSFSGNPVLFDENSAYWVLQQQFKGKI